MIALCGRGRSTREDSRNDHQSVGTDLLGMDGMGRRNCGILSTGSHNDFDPRFDKSLDAPCRCASVNSGQSPIEPQ